MKILKCSKVSKLLGKKTRKVVLYVEQVNGSQRADLSFGGENLTPGYIITRDAFTGSSGNYTQNRYLYRLTRSHIIKLLKHLPIM